MTKKAKKCARYQCNNRITKNALGVQNTNALKSAQDINATIKWKRFFKLRNIPTLNVTIEWKWILTVREAKVTIGWK